MVVLEKVLYLFFIKLVYEFKLLIVIEVGS